MPNRFSQQTQAGGPGGQNPPLSYSFVCQGLFNSEDGMNLKSRRDLSTNIVLKESIDRILSVIWGRKLARTEKLERLALLPYKTDDKKYDVICILYGCSVPIVLRRIEEKSSDGQDVWELIGECYVYELMAGEALAERRSRIDGDPTVKETGHSISGDWLQFRVFNSVGRNQSFELVLQKVRFKNYV